jgi:signal transduction histidine kinase
MQQGGTITVRTEFDREQMGIRVIFSDTGSGVAEEIRDKIFEPFFTTKPVGKGTGLGLAVSHGIIQEHGGSISVKTKRGEGTSFFIKLPAYKEMP